MADHTHSSRSVVIYKFVIIDVPGAAVTQAFSENGAGQIVGVLINDTGSHGFLNSGSSFTIIDVPGAHATAAKDINDKQQIVGVSADDGGTHGFLATSAPDVPIAR